jgi:hypothetical protein
MKNPGWKTTEFWILGLVTIVGLLLASGIIPSGSVYEQILGLIVSTASGLGYTVSRTIVKKNE